VEQTGVNKFLLVLASILALFVAAILIGPSIINWNNYKADLTNEVERLTGRNLTINGNIEISIFPAPALVANDVYLSNSEGASAKNMLSLESVEVRVALGPLLGGQVKVQTVRLINPIIELQRFADGHTNMELSFGEEDREVKNSEAPIGETPLTQASEDTQSGRSRPRFSLDNFSIKNASVIFRDDVMGRIQKIENFDANFAAASLIGPFASTGNMVVRGLPLEYTISIDKIIEERTAPISLTILLNASRIKTTFSGAIVGLDETPKFEGLVKATGENLAELIQFVNPEWSLLGLVGQEFGFQGKVVASAEAVDISELSVSLGDAVATGSAGLNVKETPNLNIGLAIDSIDLDKWLALPTIRGAMTSAPTSEPTSEQTKVEGGEPSTTVSLEMPNKPRAEKPDGPIVLPNNVDVTFNITAKSLTLNNGLVRQARLSAELSGGEVNISHASAKLPGNADVALFGFVLTDEALPRFDGKMEVSVGNVRGMMNWLDAPMPPVPADRLLKMTMSSNMLATQKKVSVSEIDLQFDSSRLTGKAAVKLAKRLSIDVDLILDRFNLDAYLRSAKPTVKPAVQSATPTPAKKIKPSEGVSMGPLAALKNFDANFKSRIRTVVYEGAQVKNINLALSLLNGTINVRHLSVAKLAGSTFKASGSFSNIGGIPEMKGVRLDAKFNDLSRFFRLLGASVMLDSKAMGTVTLAGKIDGSALNPLVDLKLQGAGASIKTNGKISFLPLVGGFDGNLKVMHGDLAGMFKSLGINYRSGGRLGGLDLESTIKADLTGLTLGSLKAQVGTVPVNGMAKILLSGPRVKIIADLNTGRIVASRYLPVSVDAFLEETVHSVSVALLAPGRPLGKPAVKRLADFSPGRWPTDPIDFSPLEKFDADIKLRSKALVYGSYSINNSVLAATVSSGILQIDKLNGELFGGKINATATAKATSPPTVESTVSLKNLSMEKGLMAIISDSPASGRAGMDVKLASSGYTTSDLVAALAGGGSIDLKGINVSRSGKGTALSSVLGLLSKLNKIGGSLSGKKAGAGLADIAGTFNVSKGIAQSGDLTLVSSIGNGQAQGKVDLSRWLINVDGQIEMSQNFIGKILKKGPSTPSMLPFSIRGDLNAPNVKLDTSKLLAGGLNIRGLGSVLKKKGIGGLLHDIVPGLGGSSQNPQPSSQSPATGGSVPPQPPPEQQQQLQPKDFLKSLLNGLGR
jgi:uncharacterized protein involved in outer membrane biogenesis